MMTEYDKRYWSERPTATGQTAIQTRWYLSQAEIAEVARTGVLHITQVVADGCLVPMAISSVSCADVMDTVHRLEDRKDALVVRISDLTVQLVSANWHVSIGLRRRIKAAGNELAIITARIAELKEAYDFFESVGLK